MKDKNIYIILSVLNILLNISCAFLLCTFIAFNNFSGLTSTGNLLSKIIITLLILIIGNIMLGLFNIKIKKIEKKNIFIIINQLKSFVIALIIFIFLAIHNLIIIFSFGTITSMDVHSGQDYVHEA